jgi:hypothetical protein
MTNSTQKEVRRALADAYSFVRSQEVNKAIQAVTMVQLLREQIDRNGDTKKSNARQFSPYTFDPNRVSPASERPLARANYLSGSDTNNPTKLDRVLAIRSIIEDLTDKVKSLTLEETTELPDDAAGELFTNEPSIIGTEAVLDDLGTIA